MILMANIEEALRSLAGAKQRTLLALTGIIIGIGSVIGMVSIGEIVEEEALRQFQDMGVNIAVVRREFSSKAAEMNLKDIVELKEHVREVLEVAPFLTSGGDYVLHGKHTFLEQMGVTHSFFELNKIRPREGRLITDLDSYRYFCVIGKEAGDFLRNTGRKTLLGSQILLGERIYTIVGVLDHVPEGGMRPSGINNAAIMHITTAGRVFQGKSLDSFLVRLGGKKTAADIKTEIQDYFGRKSRGLKVEVRTAEELIDNMKKQMRLFTILLGAIGSIALIVGGIGVMNMMLVSVAERRMEIGLRRALGALQRDIRTQFIIESVVLCLLGGVIGICLGITVSLVFAKLSKWTFLISYPSIALGFGVATAVGIFFGYYPALAAAKLDPIKALRS